MENGLFGASFSILYFNFQCFFQNAATVSAACMGVIGTDASSG